LFFILFTGAALTINSKSADFPVNDFLIAEQPQDSTTTLEVIVNTTTKIKMENIPTSGYLEVYSILGVKVSSVSLKTRISTWNIELPKGLYILKAGKVAQKIVVR
jgi:hypothetical protein